MKTVERVEGFITDIAVRKTLSGSYGHTISVGGKSYSLFQDTETGNLVRGDYVRFTANRKYVLTNPSFRGLVKVGFTTGTPQNRAQELSGATGVPTPFSVAFSLPIHGDPKKVEGAAHAILDPFRHNKEFFRVTVKQAIEAVQQAYVSVYPHNTDDDDEALAERRRIVQARMEEEKARDARARAQRAFEQTTLGRWKTSGEVRFQFGRLTVPKVGERSWLGKLFLSPHTDWLALDLACFQGREVNLHLEVRGLSDGVEFTDYITLKPADLPALFERAHAYLVLFGPKQWELSVMLPARLLSMPLPDETALVNNHLRLEAPSRIDLDAIGHVDLTAFQHIYPASEEARAAMRERYAQQLRSENPRTAFFKDLPALARQVAPAPVAVSLVKSSSLSSSIASDYGDPKAHRERLLRAGVAPEQIDAMFAGRDNATRVD